MKFEKRKEEFMKLFDRYLLCVDLEATCDSTSKIPRDEMEIIEFGGILLDRDKGWETIDRIQFTIKPTLHKKLTLFCRNLTGITQEDVDRGCTYPWSVNFLSELMGELDGPYSWCSWGEFDKNIMLSNAAMHDLPPILPPDNHFNLKVWYSSLNMVKTGFGLDKAIAREGLSFIGQHHRALSDAENVAQLFRGLVEKGNDNIVEPAPEEAIEGAP